MIRKYKRDLLVVGASLILYLPVAFIISLFRIFDFKLTVLGTCSYLLGAFCYSLYVTKEKHHFLLYSILLFVISLSFSR